MSSEATRARDSALMRRALELAARGRTSPNPQVGAVIVGVGGEVVGEGYHRRCGEAHAEVEALRDAGGAARGGTLYVTLEPCNHTGRTPPCTEAILEAGIARVVIGLRDPDADVAGGGAERLRREGLTVDQGVEGERCEVFYEAYSLQRRERRPFVLLKAAMTLDGRVATRTGHSRWVTGEEARLEVHRIRDRVDAIMVGVGTALADDPSLTTRLPEGEVGHDPTRVIVDSHLRTPAEAKVIGDAPSSSAPTILAYTEAPRERVEALSGREKVELIRCPEREGRVDLSALLRALSARGIVTLLAEGGGEMHWSLLEAGLVDRVKLFVAPLIVGGREAVPAFGGLGVAQMSDAFGLEALEISRFGRDLLLEGKIRGAKER